MRYEKLKFENIRNLRIDCGDTQQQIAELLHVKQNTYVQYELGAWNYPIEALLTLADFHGVSVDYLPGCAEIRESP